MTEPAADGPRLSGCVISYQEADRIADCVRSLDFCDEILVLDSGSTDGTQQIAAELGARVVENSPFPGHREQKQICVELAAHDWILSLDADERVTPALREEIQALRGRGLEPPGYEMPRHNHYLGRIVKRGLFWPDRKLRLFDRRAARWRGTNPHDRVEVDGGAPPQRLLGGIEHLSFRDFAEHRQTVDKYTWIAARALRDDGRRFSVLDLLIRPPAVFVKALLLKRGFVDGWRGLLIAVMAFYYDWLKYWRLRRVWREEAAA